MNNNSPDDLKAAEKAAANLVRFRFRAEKELFYRLKEKGYSVEIINQVIEKMKALKLIDDEKFSYLFAYDKMNLDKKGPVFIRNELKMLGVSEEFISNAINKVLNEIDQYETALEVAKKYYELKKDLKKVREALYRRGFESEIIKFVIDDVGGVSWN